MRSSAPGEDFDGNFLRRSPRLFRRGAGTDGQLDAVRTVWASLWTDRALLYRRELGIDPDSSTMAVVIQRPGRGRGLRDRVRGPPQRPELRGRRGRLTASTRVSSTAPSSPTAGRSGRDRRASSSTAAPGRRRRLVARRRRTEVEVRAGRASRPPPLDDPGSDRSSGGPSDEGDLRLDPRTSSGLWTRVGSSSCNRGRSPRWPRTAATSGPGT